MLLDPFEFVWRALSVLASLIDNRGGQQLRGIELAHCEALEPSLLPTREALQLRPAHIPELDVDAVRATLAEEDDRHRSSLVTRRTKDKTFVFTQCLSHLNRVPTGRTRLL